MMAAPPRRDRAAIGPAGQRGAALLMAMLTVALVASLAAAALWRQWRGVEVETAERGRTQARWILTGSLDWGRLILRQDGRSGGPDHLAEPWAIPLAEARLSTFLSSGADGSADASLAADDDAMNAFLTGYVVDLQGRLNAFNLVQNGQRSQAHYQAFQRLFSLLGLPQAELDRCVQQLLASLPRAAAGAPANGGGAGAPAEGAETADDEAVPIAPSRFPDLRRMGLSAATLARLAPFVTWLNTAGTSRTTVNLNTAPMEVLYASIDGLDQAGARKIEQQRGTTHFTSIDQARSLVARGDNAGNAAGGPDAGPSISSQLHGVSSRYFQITGQVRIDQTALGEQSVVERNGLQVRTLDRQPLASLAELQTATAGARQP